VSWRANKSFVVAADRFLAGFPDPLEIPRVRTANTDGVVDAIAEAVRQEASKLLGAEAFGHPACELRDVTLLGCLDEDSLHAERLQLGCSGSAAVRIPLNPRHIPTLRARCAVVARPAPPETPQRWVEQYGRSLRHCSATSPDLPASGSISARSTSSSISRLAYFSGSLSDDSSFLQCRLPSGSSGASGLTDIGGVTVVSRSCSEP
jgi:hypothetical protein